jgi:hypothetical protein
MSVRMSGRRVLSLAKPASNLLGRHALARSSLPGGEPGQDASGEHVGEAEVVAAERDGHQVGVLGEGMALGCGRPLEVDHLETRLRSLRGTRPGRRTGSRPVRDGDGAVPVRPTPGGVCSPSNDSRWPDLRGTSCGRPSASTGSPGCTPTWGGPGEASCTASRPSPSTSARTPLGSGPSAGTARATPSIDSAGTRRRQPGAKCRGESGRPVCPHTTTCSPRTRGKSSTPNSSARDANALIRSFPSGPRGLRAVGAAEHPVADTRTCRERAAWVGKRRDKETTRFGEGVPPSVEPLTRASGRARHGTLEQN